MELIAIKFKKASSIPNVGCYRAGEIAGFSRQLADRIVQRGHGVEYKKETRPTKRTESTKTDADK
jgi:hypothetical protein